MTAYAIQTVTVIRYAIVMETATITDDINAEIMDDAFAECLSLKYIYFKGRKIFKFTGFTQHNVNAGLKIVVNDDIY